MTNTSLSQDGDSSVYKLGGVTSQWKGIYGALYGVLKPANVSLSKHYTIMTLGQSASLTANLLNLQIGYSSLLALKSPEFSPKRSFVKMQIEK
jgi:hypothetical protein